MGRTSRPVQADAREDRSGRPTTTRMAQHVRDNEFVVVALAPPQSPVTTTFRVTASRRRRWGIVGGVDESGIVAKQRWMAWRHSRRTLLQSPRPARRPNSGETRLEGDGLDLRNEREAVRQERN